MNSYEVAYILDPNLPEESLTALSEKFSEQVRTLGGEILGVETWGRKKLAYEIKGFKDGFYILMRFKATPEISTELTRVMRLTDGVLKALTFRSSN